MKIALNTHPTTKFSPGEIEMSLGAFAALERTREIPAIFLRRHFEGDWGDVSDHDRGENERSLLNGGLLLSAYVLNDGTRIWIRTKADRLFTTIMLPEEFHQGFSS